MATKTKVTEVVKETKTKKTKSTPLVKEKQPKTWFESMQEKMKNI
jgi:hypothetical protein